jgi:hypothetical protein
MVMLVAVWVAGVAQPYCFARMGISTFSSSHDVSIPGG